MSHTPSIWKEELDFDKTMSYFIAHIRGKWALNNQILTEINFKNGNFFTFLKKGAMTDRIYHFEEGIMPSHAITEKERCVETMCAEFHELIFSFLNENSMNIAVMDMYIFKNSYEIDGELKSHIYTHKQGEFYCILDQTASYKDLDFAITTTDLDWHCMVMLTSCGMPKNKELEKSDFASFCDQVKYIITTAYDGEGYLAWKKKSSPHFWNYN